MRCSITFLPFLAIWLAANLVLEGCVYIPFARHELRGIFFDLPFSLGKCPTMTHCSRPEKQVAENSAFASALQWYQSNATSVSLFQLWESFWVLAKLNGN